MYLKSNANESLNDLKLHFLFLKSNSTNISIINLNFKLK